MIPKSFRQFLPFAALVSLAAAAGSSLTETSVHQWYKNLIKPAWTPPPMVFAPVWTILYTMMALAAWLIYKKTDWPNARKPLTLWGVQLILNAFWPGCFFALRNPLVGSIEIVVLLVAVLATTISFWRRDRTAGLLMLPYLLWTSYATALTLTIWRLNR